MENINPQSLTGAQKVLYRTGYSFILSNGGTAEEAHTYGLKQVEKVTKLRKLAAKGAIINA